jgi:hypothetical protein
MKDKKSLIINIIIVVLTIIGCVFMFTGFRFMPSEALLEASRKEMFKFFTVDSNILMAICSFIYILYKYILKKENKYIYIFKFVGTAAITLTFVTTLVFLAPLYGVYAMYNNNNLFFHLIIPVLAIVDYIFFNKYDNKIKYAVLGVIPMFIYSFYYAGNILLHLNDGGLTIKYDFYGFLMGNINNIFIVIPVIYLVTYLLSLLLVYLNKKMLKK